jgi:hypothetical protein
VRGQPRDAEGNEHAEGRESDSAQLATDEIARRDARNDHRSIRCTGDHSPVMRICRHPIDALCRVRSAHVVAAWQSALS